MRIPLSATITKTNIQIALFVSFFILQLFGLQNVKQDGEEWNWVWLLRYSPHEAWLHYVGLLCCYLAFACKIK
jgi:hypothetical protein